MVLLLVHNIISPYLPPLPFLLFLLPRPIPTPSLPYLAHSSPFCPPPSLVLFFPPLLPFLFLLFASPSSLSLPPFSPLPLLLHSSQAMGGGYEYEDTYSNIDFSFLDIGNIHVMRERSEM